MPDGLVNLDELYAVSPPYPLFVKPATEGSSKGIENYSKVNSTAELRLALQKLGHQFPDQDILIESFLSGREFTVSIMGTGAESRVIGVREHLWKTTPTHSTENGCPSDPPPNFACRLSKSSQADKMLKYNDLHDMTEPQIEAACQVALGAWKLLNCRDCGRVDIRFDSDNPGSIPNVLEVGTMYYPYDFERRKLISSRLRR